MYGLNPSDLKIIIEIVSSYPEINEAIIFGSRAMNSHEKGSDIDIAIKGNLLETTAMSLAGKLNEETPLPYFFDVLDYNRITNPELKDHIDRQGKVFYPFLKVE